MGELAGDFAALKEYKSQVRESIEPNRFDYATKKLQDIGATVTPKNDGSKSLIVEYMNHKITFYPYTGWATGKGINDGRGINHLIKQLKSLDAKEK